MLIVLLCWAVVVDAFSATTTASYTDVIVMGVGDLRTVDHGGCSAAAAASSNNVAVALVLTDDTLHHLPHVRSHTTYTVQLLHQACTAVVESFATHNIPVHIVMNDDLAADLPVPTERYHVWYEPMMMGRRGFEYTAYRQLLHHTTILDKVLPWSAALRPPPPPSDNIVVTDRYPDYVRHTTVRPQPTRGSTVTRCPVEGLHHATRPYRSLGSKQLSNTLNSRTHSRNFQTHFSYCVIYLLVVVTCLSP